MAVGAAWAAVAIQAYSVRENKKSQEKSIKIQEESAAQSTASEEVSTGQSKRQEIRQNRVRRAQLAQLAQSSGVAGASGVSGTAASLSTNLSANLAYKDSTTNSAQGLTDLNQQLSDVRVKQQLTDSFSNLAIAGLGAYAKTQE